MLGVGSSLARLTSLVGAACLMLALMASAGATERRSPGRPVTAPTNGVAPVVAVAARVEEVAGATRIVFDLSGPVPVTTSLLAGPDRLLVDLPEVNFQVDPAVGHLDGGAVGVVRAFRFGTIAPGRSRVVVDLAGPAVLRRTAVESIAGGTPSRLTIELARTDPATFRANAHADGSDAAQLPSAPAPLPTPGDSRPMIVIDPGHGGIDPGAGGATGTIEKDVVLAFAQLLAGKLTATGRYRVALTRSDDSFVSLGERVRVARDAEAALMISVHADMLSDASVSGATVYTASDQASDAESGRLASTENRADEVAGISPTAVSADVSGILFDLARRETRTYAHLFQHDLTGYWAKIAHLNRNPERSAGFKVLQAPDVPSVLLELGYLSSDKDRASLTSPVWRDRATASVVGAIDTFFAARQSGQQAAIGTSGGP